MIALRVDLLLDVERRHVDHEVGPVLPVLAAPDELRIGERRACRSRPAPSSARAVMVIFAPFQISSGLPGSSAVRRSPSASGRARG